MSTKVEQELKENVVYVRHKWTQCASYLAVKRLFMIDTVLWTSYLQY